ncbi:hypothetical protein [uncultured Vagococcus sp.]|uniref:hypothetical protein n=1 Tax=uncultured Vagococcus sp. TaxID=189676 RepID=UPI0028D30B15|nr:hypothetical protein [uncultured Vagococcus sp.]
MTTRTQKRNGFFLTWLLVKNRLLAQTGLNVFRYETDLKKKRNKKLMVAVIGLLLLMLVGYLTSMAVGYALIGLNDLTPGIALMICSVITLFFTIFKANGELFGFNDYELVMSLPISAREIINSRFINMYLWNTFISVLVMGPMGAVYGWYGRPDWYFYPLWLIGIFLSSLIPTTIAAVIGAGITAISTKFRYANVVATVLSFLLVIGILIGSMSLGSVNSSLGGLVDGSGNFDISALSSLAPVISDVINRVYPPAGLFTAGVVEGQFAKYLLFAGLSIGWYLLFVYLLSLRYQQINTAITSRANRANYQLKPLKQVSMVSALYKKTMLRILKSTVVATNLLMGCIMAIIAAGAMLAVGPETVARTLEMPGILPILKSAAPFVIGAMASMTNTACVSLALEGKTIWVIKSLPISSKTLYDSYLLVNLSFTLPTSLLCSALMGVALKPNLLETVALFVTPLVFVVATAVIGLLIGNRLAYYDWQEETQLIKQSMMSMLGMLGGLVVVGLAGVVVNIGIIPIEPILLTLIISLLVGILTVILYLNERHRPIKA